MAVGCGDDDRDAGPTTTVTATTSTTMTITSTSTTTTTSTTTSTTTTTTTTSLPPEPITAMAPVWDKDFPDPFVLATDDGYHAYATAAGLVHVQRLDASSLTAWAGPIEALGTRPDWAVPFSTWAPAVLAIDGTHLLYYTARVEGTDKHCLSVAEGPGGGEFFVDRSGRTLLAYHAWLEEPGYPGHRALRIAAVDFSGPLPRVLGGSGSEAGGATSPTVSR